MEPRDFERNMRKSLDILSRHLPRTFVVLLAPVDVSLVREVETKPFLCELTHQYECPCLFGSRAGVKRVTWLHSQYL